MAERARRHPSLWGQGRLPVAGVTSESTGMQTGDPVGGSPCPHAEHTGSEILSLNSPSHSIEEGISFVPFAKLIN